MVDFRKLKALTPAEHAAQEDGRRAQGRLSTVSNSLVVLKRHSAQGELARRPLGLDFLRNISLAMHI